MNRALLLQRCDIMAAAMHTQALNPTNTTEAVLHANVQCRLDTLQYIAHSNILAQPGSEAIQVSGILYIDNEVSTFGNPRDWNEQNWIRLEGKLWTIRMIHEQYDSTRLDHFEVVVQEGVNR